MADVYNPELKPCPFCGSKATLQSGRLDGTHMTYWVQCDVDKGVLCPCVPYTYDCDTAEEVVEAWNRRANNG